MARGHDARGAWILVAAAAVAALLVVPAALAATGDVLKEVKPGGNLARGVAFDGTSVYFTKQGETRIYKMKPDGTQQGSFDIGVQSRALDWDRTRGQLWVGSYDLTGTVYLVDPATGVKASQFTYNPGGGSTGLIVGLSHDPATDTLWIREEANGRLSKVSASGAELRAISVTSIAWGVEFDGDTLWLAVPSITDGTADILRLDLDGNELLSFGPSMRAADLALDPVDYSVCALWGAGFTGLWTFTSTLRAFEVPMPCGDKVPPVTKASLSGTSGDNGWWRSAVTVTLAAMDEPAGLATGVQKTEYRLDGGALQGYGSPFSVAGDGTHKVEFFSTDDAGNAEATRSVEFKVDATPPSTSASLGGPQGDNGWFLGSVDVTLSASDALSGLAGTSYRVDGGALQSYAGTFAVDGDALHVVEFFSQDLAGNVEATQRVEVGIDTTAPTTSASLGGTQGDAGWWRSAVTVTLAGSDAVSGVASTSYKVDGGALQGYASPFSVAGDGSHTVEFFSEDKAGNIEATGSASFKVDATPPSTSASLSGPQGNEGWFLGAVSVSLSASDATSGVAGTSFRVDGGAFQGYASPFSVAGDGIHTVEFFSTDIAGNAEAAKIVQVKIDTTPPSTSASPSGTQGDAGWWRSSVEVALSASDATSGVAGTSFRVDGGAFQGYASPFSVAGDGVHTVEFFSKDVAGNAEATRSLTVSIDTTPPSTSASPSGLEGDDGWFRSPVSVSLSASDATSGVAGTSYRVDGGALQGYAGAFVVEGEGFHTVEFFSRDVAGNVEDTRSLVLKLDSRPPSTSITVGVPQFDSGSALYVAPGTPFTLSATDATSGVRTTSYRINDGPLQAYAGGFTLGDDDGTYTIAYHSRDVAGNDEAPKTLTVLLDATAPTVDVTRPRPASLTVGAQYVELDSDLDGFPDTVEALLGSSPTSAASTPALPVLLPATQVPGVTQTVQPVMVELPGQTVVVPGVSQSFQVPVWQPAQEVALLPAQNAKLGPLEVGLPATIISIPAVGPFPAAVVELPERRFSTPSGLAVPGQSVEVPGRSVGPLGGPLPLVGTEETRSALNRAFVVGGTLLRAQVASEDPVVNGVASGVDRVVFLVDGRVAFVDMAPPYEFAWDTTRLAMGDYVLEAIGIDHVDNDASAHVRVFIIPATEEGVKNTARPHAQALAERLRAAMVPAGADFADGNGDLVPDAVSHAKQVAVEQGLAAARAGDAIAAGDANGDGFPDAASAALAAAADASLPPPPSVPGQSASTPGASLPNVPGQSVTTPAVNQQVGPAELGVPAQTVSTPAVGPPSVPAQTVTTPAVQQGVGPTQLNVPSQSATTPAVEAPSVPPQSVAVPGASPSYPEGVPTSCTDTSAGAAAGATLGPTRVELPNGAYVVLPLPAPSQAATAGVCGQAPSQFVPAPPQLPAPPQVPVLPPLPP